MTSEIRANKQTNRVGLGTVTYTDTGIIVSGIVTANSLGGIGHINVGSNIQLGNAGVGTFGGIVSPNADIDDFISVGSNIHLGNAGVVTATSFSGSGANLTSLPAGQLTGALPAISGANLTGISQVGGATSVRFNDDVKAFFGTSSSTDCEIVRNSNAVAGQDSLTVKSDLPFIVSTNNLSNIQFYVNNNSGNNGLIFDNNGLKPSSNNNVKLGSSSYKYSSLYAVNVFATTLFGDGSNLSNLPAGAPVGGASTNTVFFENDIAVAVNYQITSNKNAMSAGPISINAGIAVTVPSGSSWTIV